MSVPLSSAGTSTPMARKGSSGGADASTGPSTSASTGSMSTGGVRVPLAYDYEGARERSRVLRTLSHLSKTQASSSSLDGYAYPETESDSEAPTAAHPQQGQRSGSSSPQATRPTARSPAASLRGSFSAFARGAAAAVRATGAASGAGGGAVYYSTDLPGVSSGTTSGAAVGGRSSRRGSSSDQQQAGAGAGASSMPISSPTTPGATPTRRPRRESPGVHAGVGFATASRTSASPTHTLSPRTSPSSSFSASRAGAAAAFASPEQQGDATLATPTQRNPDPASAAASRRSSSSRFDAFASAPAARGAPGNDDAEESYFDAHDVPAAPSPLAASPAASAPLPLSSSAMQPSSSSSLLPARRPSGVVVFDEPPLPPRARKVSTTSSGGGGGGGASASVFRRWASASSEALGFAPSTSANDHLEAAAAGAGRASMDVSRAPVAGGSRRASRAAVLEQATAAARNSNGDGMEMMSSPVRATADGGEGSTQQSRSARSSFSLFTRRGSAAAAQEPSGSLYGARRPSHGDASGLRAPAGADRSRRTSLASRFGRSRDNLALDADAEEEESARGGSGFKGFFKKTLGRASGANTPASASASTFASPNPSRPSIGGFTPAASSPTLAETEEATQTFASAFGQPISSRGTAAPVPHEDVGPLGERLPQAPVPQGPAPAYSATWAEMLGTDRPSPLSSPSDRGSAATVATDGTSASCHLGAPTLAAVAAVAAPSLPQVEQAKPAAGPAPEAPHAPAATPAARSAPSASAASSSALGIDQEQARAEASARQASSLGLTISASPTPSLRGTSRSSSASGTGGAAGGGSQPPRRPRAVGRLSQLPRLDSMRIEREDNGDAGQGRGGASDRERRGSHDGGGAGDDSEEDTGDEENADAHETETETESEEEGDGTGGSEEERDARQQQSAAVAAAPGTTAPRALPPGGIQLPPAPAFRNGAPQLPDVTPIAVGRESWARFAEATPFETPRNTLSPQVTPSARPHEASYFSHRPAPARTAQGHAPGADMPPPSPSVISRSRAPSSASLRSARSPAQVFGALAGPSSGTREMPPPPLPHTASALKLVKPPSRASTISSASGAPIGRIGPSGEPLSPASPTAMLPPNLLRPATERLGLAPLPPVAKAPAAAAAATQDRPGLYQQKSRSLIDLSAPLRRDFAPATERLQSPARTPVTLQPSTAGAAANLLSPSSMDDADVALHMRRRRSMFEVGAAPPPYSIIHRRPEGPQVILPREEEGRERLPGYFCGVHIEGYLPRKMEFSAPGVQAKDRSWRRLYFVLHGTSLRVYKHDLSASALPSKGVWGSMSGTHVHLEPMNAATPVQTKDGPLVAPSSSSSAGGSGVLGSSGITPKAVVANIVHASSEARTIGGSNAAAAAAPPTPARNYTLQGAESGLAADYLKRRHVVRVRLEGEQFLLQTRNDRHVVDWIEALQASTNVALDLEKRAMPKFITLPRRRRRRRPQGQGDPDEERARAAEEADLAEAQRRSMRDAGGSRSARASDAATPAPSSAFDEMLREEHAHMQRVEASDI